MDFLFHEVSDKEREEIKEQAKSIMCNFSEKISKVKEKVPEHIIERDEFERQEAEPLATSSKLGQNSEEKIENPESPNSDFRERMFENAPNKNKDFILGEKKKW